MKSLTLVKREEMNTKVAKKTLHDLIDRIEDDEVLNLYVKLLEREIRKTASQDFFKNHRIGFTYSCQSVIKIGGGRQKPKY
jgi:hypothetical protein